MSDQTQTAPEGEKVKKTRQPKSERQVREGIFTGITGREVVEATDQELRDAIIHEASIRLLGTEGHEKADQKEQKKLRGYLRMIGATIRDYRPKVEKAEKAEKPVKVDADGNPIPRKPRAKKAAAVAGEASADATPAA